MAVLGGKDYRNIDMSHLKSKSRQRLSPYRRSRQRDHVTHFVDGVQTLAHKCPEFIQLGPVMAIALELRPSLVYIVQDLVHVAGSR